VHARPREYYWLTEGKKVGTARPWGVNITIQWSISSEGLNTYNHAFGSTIGGDNSTFHHNLWACNTGRNPSIGMDGDFSLLNNVLYNWRHRTVDGGDQKSQYNIINNYYKPGPATSNGPVAHRVLRPDGRRAGRDKTGPREWGRAYVAGNVVAGNEAVTNDNWAGGVQIDGDDDPAVILPRIRVDEPFPMAPVPLQRATDAYESVLAHAGATLPKRDGVDRRIIEQVRKGTVTGDAPTFSGIVAVTYQSVKGSVTAMPLTDRVAMADELGPPGTQHLSC